jgi:CubicO group peptidase (beta-lactamase class C family)
MPRVIGRARLLLPLAAIAVGCSGGGAAPGPVSSSLPGTPRFYVAEPFAWPAASPEQEGMDGAALDEAFRQADALPYAFSLLVVRHGFLVAERYFNGASPQDAHFIHSASKSFTSALVGIALDQGYLPGLDAKLLDYFPEDDSPELDPRKRDITLRHLLSMRAGFDWVETRTSFSPYMNSPDWSRYTIELPLRDAPGERFNYCTPETNLVAVIVARASGMSLRDLAQRFLFGPLGITISYWERDPAGYYTGGHAMCFTPRDMARFGYLYLNGGWIDGQRVIPEEWVRASLTRTGRSGWDWGALEDEGYGYLWWLGRLAGHPVFFASGKGGQLIIDVPDLDMVVVTTTNGELWETEWSQIQEMIGLVARNVLPAAHPDA